MLDMSKPYRYFYVEGVTDMRMGHYRLCNMIRETLKRDPYNGDVYIFMSKKRNTVKLLRYENHAYALYTKTYEHEFRFLKISASEGQETCLAIDRTQLSAMLNCPDRRILKV